MELIGKGMTLGEAAQRWEMAGRPRPGSLMLRPPALDEAERWVAAPPRGAPDVTDVIRAFITASRQAFEQEQAARKADIDRYLVSQSRLLAELAKHSTCEGDAGAGMLLAIEALPDARNAVEHPHVEEAEFQLLNGIRHRQEVRVLSGHRERVISAAFSPDGRRVVTASDDGAARIWDRDTGELLNILDGAAARMGRAKFSHDGQQVLAGGAGMARIWNASTGAELAVFRAARFVQCVAFSPDDRRLVTASQDGSVVLWNTETGDRIANFGQYDNTLEVELAAPYHLHDGTPILFMFSVAFAPDGRRVLTASADRTARIWIPETGKEIACFSGHSHYVTGAAFSPNGRRVVTGSADKTARVWDARNGKQIAVFAAHDDAVTSAAFSPDGRHVVTGSKDNTARIWEAATGSEIAVFRGHDKGLNGAEFSADGKFLITASDDGTARLWEVNAGKEMIVLAGHDGGLSGAAFSPDGRRVVTAALAYTPMDPTGRREFPYEPPTVRLWEAETGRWITFLFGHRSDINSAAFSPDGQRLVTASDDRTARIWDAETHLQIAELVGHEGALASARFSPDGRHVVTASWDKTARIWDAQTRREITRLRGHARPLTGAAFSPDGRRVVTASWDNTARIWDVGSAQQIAVLTGQEAVRTDFESLQSLTGAAFSPDSRRVVTASVDGTARIWNVETHEQIVVLRGHLGRVTAAEFSPDGRHVLTASEDKTARLWEAETGNHVAALKHDDAVCSAAFSPNGRSVITICKDRARIWKVADKQIAASDDRTARLWDVFSTTRDLIGHAKQAVPRGLTQEQREKAFLSPEPPAWYVEMEKWPYQTDEWKEWLRYKRANANPPLPGAAEWKSWLASRKSDESEASAKASGAPWYDYEIESYGDLQFTCKRCGHKVFVQRRGNEAPPPACPQCKCEHW
jgi:WD40 repeat protein